MPSDLSVEVRRAYRGSARQAPAYVQLVSTNVTDLSDLWGESDERSMRDVLRFEVQFAALIIGHLAEVFTPGGRGSYRSVDTA